MGDFHGLPTRNLSNKYLVVEYLAEAGPRLVRLMLTRTALGINQLAEVPQMKWDTPYGPFFIHGGHRLWHAPEAAPRTYMPDNAGLIVTDVPGGVELRLPAEAVTGISKSLTLQLDPERAALTLTHRLCNEGPWPIELAPWAITQLPHGGVIVLPQRQRPAATSDLLPNRQLVLWPYTRWADTRLSLNDDFVLLNATPRLPPCKIGYFNPHGWMGYLCDGVFFVKRFTPQPDLPHADFGCNAETYCNDQFVEMETLGPLTRLEPGQAATHVEEWEFYTGVTPSTTLEKVRATVAALKLPMEN